MSVFQELYDSEINFSISTFWDGGFDVKLGDEMNGFRAETSVWTWAEVETWLREKAIEHFPQSGFAEAARNPTTPIPPPGHRG
jgi:hypothetical protein